ncbi:MAG: YitT family protein [Clostridia bacterium]|nr:YitT family protein [Clostridia bacterium]
MKAKSIGEFAVIILSSFLYAVGTHLFIFPVNVLLGGTSGISVILTHFLPFSPGLILTFINVVLMLIAFIILGKTVAVRTVVGSLSTTVFIAILDRLFYVQTPPIPNVYLSALLGAAVIAVSSALLFSLHSSSGGTDIVALIIKKYSSIKIGHALLLTDILIVLIGGFLLDVSVAVASGIGLLVKTQGINLLICVAQRVKRARGASVSTKTAKNP